MLVEAAHDENPLDHLAATAAVALLALRPEAEPAAPQRQHGCDSEVKLGRGAGIDLQFIAAGGESLLHAGEIEERILDRPLHLVSPVPGQEND